MKPAQSGNIYEDILGEMASEHNSYINNLVVNHSKKKSLRETNKKSAVLADDDELQYAASAKQPVVVGRLKLEEDPTFTHHGSVEDQHQQEYDDAEMNEWMGVINSSRQGSRQHRSSSRPRFFEQPQS